MADLSLRHNGEAVVASQSYAPPPPTAPVSIAERDHERVVAQVYEQIINTVMDQTKVILAEEGLDLSLVQELRTMWEKRLDRSLLLAEGGRAKAAAAAAAIKQDTKPVPPPQGTTQAVSSGGTQSVNSAAEENPAVDWSSAPLSNVKVIVPTAEGSQEVTLRVPNAILSSPSYVEQLHGIFASPEAGNAVSMRPSVAKIYLQRLINAAMDLPADLGLDESNAMPQLDGEGGDKEATPTVFPLVVPRPSTSMRMDYLDALFEEEEEEGNDDPPTQPSANGKDGLSDLKELEPSVNEKGGPSDLTDLKKIKLIGYVNKGVHLTGVFGSDFRQLPALISLEPAELVTKDCLEICNSDRTQLQQVAQNDVCATYSVRVPEFRFKCQIVHPASEKEIKRRTQIRRYYLYETPTLHEQITKGFITEQSKNLPKWVEDALAGRSGDRILASDLNTRTGFVIVRHPDVPATLDRVDQFHYVGISRNESLKSLRDFSFADKICIRDLLTKGVKAVIEAHPGLTVFKVRKFVEYLPCFFRFHIHFRHVSCEEKVPASVPSSTGAHEDEIHEDFVMVQNIILKKDFYQRATLPIVIRSDQEIYSRVIKHWLCLVTENKMEASAGDTAAKVTDVKRTSSEALESADDAKKSRNGTVNADGGPSNLKSLKNIKRIGWNDTAKVSFLQGNFEGLEGDAIVTLEPQQISSASMAEDILKREIKLNQQMFNDIYGDYSVTVPDYVLKASIIHPAQQKHILKYKQQDRSLLYESKDTYKNITLPDIQEKTQLSLKWVENILDGVAEQERVILDEPDSKKGFVMVRDFQCDGLVLDQLHYLAIARDLKLKSIRDLNETHMDLLVNIYTKGTAAMLEKHPGLRSAQIRAFFHYLPSFYHLHVHFAHVDYDRGISSDRCHLLRVVMDNISVCGGDYYQKATLPIMLKEEDPLLSKILANLKTSSAKN
ncbi:unnamed protein product [Cyprideis torosa]|uniref:m7GpppX diphosphatase n=1 Tax=Cyprideis torosa TaxID=163714 RepID=A0A7R8W538_9CRUS|nr:unnamed protein product [Cyprideis torosa]CAG0884822.1 unnamed protein product [Cyprideis torosa]